MNRHSPKSTATADRILLTACLVTLAAVVAYPTVRMLAQAVYVWDWSVLGSGGRWEAVRNTLVMSLATVATSGVLGTGMAFLLTRVAFPGRRLLAAMAYLPFVLPPLVGVISFYYLIGRDGFVPRFLAETLGMKGAYLTGPVAILTVHTYSFYVFFYAMVSAALEGLDASPGEAARTLGASRFRVFTRVTIPMLRPALVGASLLTFMSSGASFSAPLIFGDGYPMLTVAIYNARGAFNNGEAYTLTVVLTVIALIGVVAFRSGRTRASGGSKGAPRPVASRTGRVLAVALTCVVVVALLAPHLTIVWLSFVAHAEWNEEVIPPVLTVANYVEIVQSPEALRPVLNSVWMSGLAAVVTLLVAAPAAYLIGRKRRGGALVNGLVMIPWALPGTVVAMNLIAAFNDRWLPVYGTVWILPLAYFVRNVPLLTRMSTAAVEPFDATLIEAGRSLGGSRWFCIRRIVAPLLAPAVGAGLALVFATSLGEFVASILLYTPDNMPIAMQIYMARSGSGIGTAFAYSVFLMMLVGATFVTARKFSVRAI
ncbi:MAG: iron ABC transporter permease [bacterium]|nr:iron ABC transporter permease [bacterium]